jgi:transposase
VAPLLRKFLAELRKKHQQADSASALTLDAATQTIELPASLPAKPRITCRMSATRASWLFVSQAGKLDEKQTQNVAQIRAGHPDLEKAYQLSQEFVMMLAERREADLENWLTQAEQRGLPEFKKMANGIRQDYAAVKAAICQNVWLWHTFDTAGKPSKRHHTTVGKPRPAWELVHPHRAKRRCERD